MSYTLGIDIGTTFTAAATLRGGRAQIVPLGGKADTIPSVVLLREDGTLLTGDAAQRRGLSEPHRIAREFKRRFGQPEPVLLGGAPHSPEALTAALLRSVLDEVSKREGGLPDRICLSHPANWGPFKTDLFGHVVRLADIGVPITFTTEPEAAAASYAHEQRMEPGAVVAVYDLGGGTFDAAVLRKTRAGFEILGRPEGIEQLGGIDVDAAVFHHATQAVAEHLAELDEDDPAAVAAVARLKRECVDAKEALSSDTDVSIPVLLPAFSTDVRLTRIELEQMVRPMLGGTIHALRRALESANVAPDDLTSVLLVGGASRMPIVAQLVGAELGRPVAIDTHPKHAVALGAAWLAEDAGRVPTDRPSGTGSAAAATAVAAGLVGAGATEAIAHTDRPGRVDMPQPGGFQPTMVMNLRDLADAEPSAGPGYPPGGFDPYSTGRSQQRVADHGGAAPPVRVGPPPAPVPARPGKALPILAIVLLLLVIGAGVLIVPRLLDGSSVATTTTAGPTDDGGQAELEAAVEADRAGVAELADRWVPQVALQVPGESSADGRSGSPADIVSGHEELAGTYPGALLVWTGDYPSSFDNTDAFATLVDQTFHSPEAVVTWCADEGLAADACVGKRISETGDPDKNTFSSDEVEVKPTVRATPKKTTSTTTEPTDTWTDTPTDSPTTEPTESPTGEATGNSEATANEAVEAIADEGDTGP